jgi:hypothetical protein
LDAQRAVVQGFVPQSSISEVRRVFGRRHELILVTTSPGTHSKSSNHLASRHKGKDATWFGDILGPRSIGMEYKGLHLDLIAELRAAWQVLVIDDQ